MSALYIWMLSSPPAWHSLDSFLRAGDVASLGKCMHQRPQTGVGGRQSCLIHLAQPMLCASNLASASTRIDGHAEAHIILRHVIGFQQLLEPPLCNRNVVGTRASTDQGSVSDDFG